jgi:uncharacterized protein (DUF433 family)
MSEQPIIERDPEVLGGLPVFPGTRVPVHTLLDYLLAGQPLDEFLDDFPTVDRAQAISVLNYLKQVVLAQAHETAA